MAKFLLALLLALPAAATGEPFAVPGDLLLRSDLQRLNDSGEINITLSAWPVSTGDIHNAIATIDARSLSPANLAAYQRIRDRLRIDTQSDAVRLNAGLSASIDPRFIRTFENTPRDEGELSATASWQGSRFAIKLSATAVANPFDNDKVRPDGTYVGMALGNWIISAGWQERWWGPGRDGSLILSTNARPSPGISIQRNSSTAFKSKWLSWIGPWTLTSFMTELDDTRTINEARLFGIRGSFRPPNTGLEIGISRTAQWCGDGRPCNLGTFGDLLVGNDNRGVNVDPADEPGNQLGGFDIRWRLPKQMPAALYMQWIGEDGRGGGGAIGAWLRQFGAEFWGTVGGISHRTHVEWSDTTCREGGFGFSDLKPNCAYGHSIYNTGYRYDGRSIGHSLDGDGLSYSFGSTLVQSAGHSWNISLRYMEINRNGVPDGRHTLSPVPVQIVDLQLSHQRSTPIGQFQIGLSLSDIDGTVAEHVSSDFAAYVQWSSQ
tara:strand:- start:32875 stop:34347 length:1473 start_codon:yes stop_codon:yes gene_type:complete